MFIENNSGALSLAHATLESDYSVAFDSGRSLHFCCHLQELEVSVDEEKMNNQRSLAELNLIINEVEGKLAKKDEELESVKLVNHPLLF